MAAHPAADPLTLEAAFALFRQHPPELEPLVCQRADGRPESAVALLMRGTLSEAAMAEGRAAVREICTAMVTAQAPDGPGCRTCRRNLLDMLTLRGAGGSPVLQVRRETYVRLPPVYQRMLTAMAAPLDRVTGVVVLVRANGSTIGTERANGSTIGTERAGGFWHLCARVTAHSGPLVDQAQGAAVWKYVRDYLPLIDALFQRIGRPGIHADLDRLLCWFAEINHAHVFTASTQWLRRSLPEDYGTMDSCSRATFCITALLVGSAHPSRICEYYHQCNNNLHDMLASGETAEALRAFIATRANPRTRLRPTTTPTAAVAAASVASLGDFEVSLMTTVAAIRRWGAVEPAPAPAAASASDGIGKTPSVCLEIELAPSSQVTPGFVVRTGSAGDTPSSVAELLMYMQTGRMPELWLEVDAVRETGSCAHAVEISNLYETGRIKIPFSWAFHHKTSPATFGLGGRHKVRAVLPLVGSHAVLLILDGADFRKVDGCGLFPEDLTEDYARTCRKAFEQMNTTKRLLVPIAPHHGYAVGVGFCGTRPTPGTGSHQPNELLKPMILSKSRNGPTFSLERLCHSPLYEPWLYCKLPTTGIAAARAEDGAGPAPSELPPAYTPT